MASMSTSSSSSRSSSVLDDPSNPLYLHNEESPGAMLVYQPLVGENYPTWARSMQMALIAKNKLGFIDGTLTLSSPMVKTSSAIQAWIRCNKMVASWILNSVSQEISTSIVCKDTALEIWNDLRERLSQANGPRVFQLQKDIAFTNNETHMTNNVIQQAVHATSMAEFVANNSELGSPTISEERIPSLVEYSFTPLAKLESVSSVLNGANPIPANNTYTDANGARSLSISLLFPPPMSEIETDDSCSESNEAPHAAAQFSNSVLNGTNPIPTNNSNTDANGARSLSISFLFPPPMSEIETDDSCSESNETPRAATQFSYSISSCFPPGRSETDSSSEIYEIIPVDPSSTANPRCTANFEEILKPKSSNSSKSNRTPLKFSHSKINSILSLFFAAKSRTNSSKRPRHTILPTRFKGVEYGTLSGHLHNPKSTSLMSWAARIKVALDIARGIEFLHVYAVPSIIHRNIKPSNIFLDATLTAKLSNFNRSMNASKWCDHVINKAIGIDGGIDPEFRSTLHLTTRVDVYSFGKVLLEMLSGSKQFHVTNIYEEDRCLVKFVAPYIAQEKIHKFLDPKVPPPTPLEMEALANVATLALDCVSIQSVLHPSMTKVANTIQSTLEGILEGQVIPYNSIACSCESISDAESEIIIDVDIGSFGV